MHLPAPHRPLPRHRGAAAGLTRCGILGIPGVNDAGGGSHRGSARRDTRGLPSPPTGTGEGTRPRQRPPTLSRAFRAGTTPHARGDRPGTTPGNHATPGHCQHRPVSWMVRVSGTAAPRTRAAHDEGSCRPRNGRSLRRGGLSPGVRRPRRNSNAAGPSPVLATRTPGSGGRGRSSARRRSRSPGTSCRPRATAGRFPSARPGRPPQGPP